MTRCLQVQQYVRVTKERKLIAIDPPWTEQNILRVLAITFVPDQRITLGCSETIEALTPRLA